MKLLDENLSRSEACKVSDKRFQELLAVLPAAAYTCDADGLITYFNQRAVDTWGRQPKLNDSKDRYCGAWKLLRPDGTPVPHGDCWMARALTENREYSGEEIVLERPDGTRVEVLAHAHPFHDSEGQVVGAVNILVDVSEHNHLQAKLRQSQKMEAIGQLAGGIAHDFNNMLSVILGHTSLLGSSNNLTEEEHISAQEAWQAAQRAASLTRQLLAFSRKQVTSFQVVDLNEAVQGLEKMLKRLLGEDLRLEIQLSEQLKAIKIDPSQLDQIILNLALNSRDAMPRGGTLEICTDSCRLEAEHFTLFPELEAGEYIKLVVRDTGCGIDEADQAKIFESFFTTKDPGKGTGLGLATIYGTVKQCGGHVWFHSSPGVGTTFEVLLPAVADEADPIPQEETHVPSLQGNETILLVEDEMLVSKLVLNTLRLEGYHVLAAQNGVEALEVYEQHNGPIHLLITDVVMPEMSGRELAELLCEEVPDLKVLYMSGYPNDSIVRHGIQESLVNFMQKPFTPRELVERVVNALRGPRMTKAGSLPQETREEELSSV